MPSVLEIDKLKAKYVSCLHLKKCSDSFFAVCKHGGGIRKSCEKTIKRWKKYTKKVRINIKNSAHRQIADSQEQNIAILQNCI